jgi:hypothetical protein
MNRDRLVRRGAVLVAALAVVLFVGWTTNGWAGMLFALAIGSAVAAAIVSDGKETCVPEFLRRRE